MPLILRTWHHHQRAGIRNVLTTRISRVKAQAKSRGPRWDDLLSPYAMNYVSVACLFSADFGRFADAIGDRADGYFLRVLQWCGHHAPFTGAIDTQRPRFASVALGNRYVTTPGRALGNRVYDALLEFGLADPLSDELLQLAQNKALALAKAPHRYVASLDGRSVTYHATSNEARNVTSSGTSNDGIRDQGTGIGDHHPRSPNPRRKSGTRPGGGSAAASAGASASPPLMLPSGDVNRDAVVAVLTDWSEGRSGVRKWRAEELLAVPEHERNDAWNQRAVTLIGVPKGDHGNGHT